MQNASNAEKAFMLDRGYGNAHWTVSICNVAPYAKIKRIHLRRGCQKAKEAKSPQKEKSRLFFAVKRTIDTGRPRAIYVKAKIV